MDSVDNELRFSYRKDKKSNPLSLTFDFQTTNIIDQRYSKHTPYMTRKIHIKEYIYIVKRPYLR